MGKKKIFDEWKVKFLFLDMVRVGVSGTCQVQLTCTRLQVWQERKKGGWLRGKECTLSSSLAWSLISEHNRRADVAQVTGQELCVLSVLGLPAST